MNAPDAPFDAPWQAQIFAMTVALNEAGHFTWSEWADVFGPKVQRAEATEYWYIWAEALEDLLASSGLAESEDVAKLTAAWKNAALRTPHGEPIELRAEDTA